MSYSELARTLRLEDRDRYVSVLYAPSERREALFALYAFNVEIARIRERIHEALPGEIRIQWWRDVIAGEIESGGHPIARALLSAIEKYELPRQAFDAYLEARIFDLYNDPMPDRNTLEGYCGETASTLIQLASLVLDRDAASRHADLAGHAGCAQAIAGLLRLLPIHRARGQCYIPADLLEAVGTTPETFLSESGTAASHALQAMLALGREHWEAFRQEAGRLPASLRPAYLAADLSGLYLDRIEAAGSRCLEAPPRVSEMRRDLHMLRRALFGWK